MHWLNWDLMIVIPIQIVKLMLANGVVFENEVRDERLRGDVVRGVREKCE